METKKTTMTQDAESFRVEEVKTTAGQIYGLVGKAIAKIGAIGKEKKNLQQGFMYRGIDQVYNALNPVLSELGLFFVPEVLDMKREERTNKNGTVIIYTILTMKYTAYAPDGSNVQMTVMGEGMDTGDKSCNKAMSTAMKYAMFQLFCIPTEEMKDPDADVYTDVLPKGQKPAQKLVQKAPESASVSRMDKLPQEKPEEPRQAQKQPENAPETAGAFLKRRIAEMSREYEPWGFDFMSVRAELIRSGTLPDIPSATLTMDQAKALIGAVDKFYDDKRAAS